MSNDALRGIEGYVTDTRDRSMRDYRLIALDNDSSQNDLQITPKNLSHYEANPYTFEDKDEELSTRTDYKIQANLWRPFPAKTIENSEYLCSV